MITFKALKNQLLTTLPSQKNKLLNEKENAGLKTIIREALEDPALRDFLSPILPQMNQLANKSAFVKLAVKSVEEMFKFRYHSEIKVVFADYFDDQDDLIIKKEMKEIIAKKLMANLQTIVMHLYGEEFEENKEIDELVESIVVLHSDMPKKQPIIPILQTTSCKRKRIDRMIR